MMDDMKLMFTRESLEKVSQYCLLARELFKEENNPEIGGFLVVRKPEEGEEMKLVVEDAVLAFQTVTGGSVEMEDEDVAKTQMELSEKGVGAKWGMRLWWHTHPFGDVKPNPSSKDWETFREVMHGCSWKGMVIFPSIPCTVREVYAWFEVDVEGLNVGTTLEVGILEEVPDELREEMAEKVRLKQKDNIHMINTYYDHLEDEELEKVLGGWDQEREVDVPESLWEWLYEEGTCLARQAHTLGITVEELLRNSHETAVADAEESGKLKLLEVPLESFEEAFGEEESLTVSWRDTDDEKWWMDDENWWWENAWTGGGK
jgi:hypothetical protein